jgi:hypothetical protein
MCLSRINKKERVTISRCHSERSEESDLLLVVPSIARHLSYGEIPFCACRDDKACFVVQDGKILPPLAASG